MSENETETIKFLREKLAEAQVQNDKLQAALESAKSDIKNATNLIIDFIAEYSTPNNSLKTEDALGGLKNFIRERCDSGSEKQAAPNA
jgi:hypothetical protein